MANVLAFAVIQDLTYTARRFGQDVSVEYVGGGTAGFETVSVVDRAITVTIEDTVSTANQIKAAVELNGDATALTSVEVTGTGSNTQTVQGPTSLSGETVSSTKDFYQDETVALTGSFVYFPFGFHANMVVLYNDGVTGEVVDWSFGGTSQGGTLKNGSSIIFDRSLPGIAGIALKGDASAYRLEVVGK